MDAHRTMAPFGFGERRRTFRGRRSESHRASTATSAKEGVHDRGSAPTDWRAARLDGAHVSTALETDGPDRRICLDGRLGRMALLRLIPTSCSHALHQAPTSRRIEAGGRASGPKLFGLSTLLNGSALS